MTRCPSNHSKLFIAVLFALATTLTVSGCGGGSDSEPDGEQGVASIAAADDSAFSLQASGEESEPAFVAPEGPEGARLRFGAAVGAPLASPLSSIASVAMSAYTKINACLKNKEIGQPCLASDAANIRETLRQVKELRSVLDRNQKQLQEEMDSLRDLIRQSDLTKFSRDLFGMVNNTEAVSHAYEALALCASTTEATCSPYIGEPNAPAIDVPTAIAKTRGYMVEKLQLLPFDLPTTATMFTGTAVFGYRDGLADALWRYNKLRQDREVGVEKPSTKDLGTVPLVTPKLATEHNSDMRYWVDAFTKYAFFRVMRDGFMGDLAAMERRQTESNVHISSSASRESVYGAGLHYLLPSLPATAVLLVDWADASKQQKKAWVVTNATARGAAGARALRADDIDNFVRIANAYAPFESLSKVPGVMPADGWYWAWTPVIRQDFSSVRVVSSGGNQGHGQWSNVQVNWLTSPEKANTWCSARVRANTKGVQAGGLSSEAVRLRDGFNVISTPTMDLKFSLDDTWDKFVKGKRIEYNQWSTIQINVSVFSGQKFLGLGSWVDCQQFRPDSYIELVKVPNVMDPLQ